MDDPVLEQLVEKIAKPFREAASAPAGSQTTDAVKHLPDGDGREANAFGLDRIEKGGDLRFGPRAHHLGDDVGVYQPRERGGHPSSPPENDSGL